MLKFPRNKFSNIGSARTKEQEQVLAESRVNGGMVTSIDAADLDNRQFQQVKNFLVRNDLTSRRFGSVLYTPLKPNSLKVLMIAPYEKFDGTISVVRITPSTVHLGSALAWATVVGVLNGGHNDRFNFTVINDRFFFSNNGVDYIQEINSGALTFARAGNAPRYKYITSFNNRVLGANEVDAITPNPIKVGWTGNLNLAEWDPLVDQSAGYVSLIDSPTDFSDNISGIFGFTETALLLRQRSLWGINKQPIASNPFVFFVIAPGIGCDSPNTAVSVRNGICWYDYRSGTVYLYKVGMQEPEPIGRPVEKSIQLQVDNKNTLFAGFNPIEDEYTLCIPSSTTSVVSMWTYNFRTKAWWNEDQINISSLANLDYLSGSLVINDLLGKINDLLGVINDLSVEVATPTRFYGKTSGEINIESRIADEDDGVPYTSELISKVYTVPKNDVYVFSLKIKYIPRLAGEFTLSYSKDGGEVWNIYKTCAWTGAELGMRMLCIARKHIHTGHYIWKLESVEGLFDLIDYEIKETVSSGETKAH